ncbi:MAG TPA: ABC transporter ATP-binding protein [bacterium (Candidatus Stahlbacteria)]|nr:ABC transporter ATP-binding protein [Candidatus Stahlbacteria bacterium]
MGLMVKNLNFAYRDGKVLENISFEVKEGEVCAILGPNGSGKTTLIKCLNRLLSPQSGDIEVDGTNIQTFGRRELAKTFAYVPQVHIGGFPYTVIEMILMGRTPYLDYYSNPGQKDYEMAYNVLKELGLLHLMDRFFNELSGGEKQLIYLGRALVQDAKVLLLDEPTSHLDFRNELLIIEKIKEVVKLKRLVAIAALHNPNEVFWLSDKVLVLHQGKIINYGTPDEVVNSATMEKVYGVSVEILSTNGKKGVIPK